MKVYLACLEHDCGCADTTVKGVFTSYDEAEKFAEEQLALPENKYFSYSLVQEFEVQ